MVEQSIIDIHNLVVYYRDVRAVDELTLQVKAGEIFGLLGPNGAGKTSTLACIEGLRQPNSGQVRINGQAMHPSAHRLKQQLGVQLQTAEMFAELNISELIELYAALYDHFLSRAQVTQLLEQFGLQQKARVRAGQLSGGQQQRLALLLAVVNDPQIVLLDEPTTGLDPQARRGVWALIRRMQVQGRTVVLTTHSMEEAQALCDRVGIMDAGRLVVFGTPAELIVRYAPMLPSEEAARRQPNLEDVFLVLTGHALNHGEAATALDEEAAWLARIAA